MEKKTERNDKKDKLDEIFADERQITETLQRAVNEAILVHKRAGNSVATWKDGKAVIVKPNLA